MGGEVVNCDEGCPFYLVGNYVDLCGGNKSAVDGGDYNVIMLDWPCRYGMTEESLDKIRNLD
jgi:hypothetical protein